tara:strand:- start:27078 stop:27416 length:339 start_codon:yes stop_codon:yes gene_type:complete
MYNMIKKFKNWVIALISTIGSIFVLFTIFKNKNPKKSKKILENEKIIGLIKKDLSHLQETKKKAKVKVKELETKADGRSKKVRNAKKEVEVLNKTISEVEADLKAKEKLIGL